MTLDGRPLQEHVWIPKNQDAATELGPGGEFSYVAAPAMGGPLSATVALRWVDDSGEPGAWDSQLRL
jgi:hypothetical protein